MLSFICTTAICVQQMLGIGYVIAQDRDTLVYSNFNTVYNCHKGGPIYSCVQGDQADSFKDPFYR